MLIQCLPGIYDSLKDIQKFVFFSDFQISQIDMFSFFVLIKEKVYDRIGTDQKTVELFGVKVPMLEIPVKPGRNLPIILEAAAKNERLKRMGYFSARDFNQNIIKWIETGEAQAVYYSGDDFY